MRTNPYRRPNVDYRETYPRQNSTPGIGYFYFCTTGYISCVLFFFWIWKLSVPPRFIQSECFIDFSTTKKVHNLTCVDYRETHLSLQLYFCGAIRLFLYIANMKRQYAKSHKMLASETLYLGYINQLTFFSADPKLPTNHSSNPVIHSAKVQTGMSIVDVYH